jgi:hypothetical protein
VLPPYRRFDLAHADPADRPTDAAYDRFVYLAARYRDHGYDDSLLLAHSPFLIQGPLFNAIWRWSAQALAEVARLVGDDPAPHQADTARIHQAMPRELWDPNGRRFGTRDLRTNRRTPEDTILAFVPLLDPGLPRPMVAAIVELLRSPCFTRPKRWSTTWCRPTTCARPGSTRAATGAGRCGSTPTGCCGWGLRRHGVHDLAAELRSSMLGLVRRSGFREYFHPFGGQGFGASGFAWSAALVIDVLHRHRARSGQPGVTAQ